MNARLLVGLAGLVGVAIGISGWIERRAVEKDFKRLEHDFHHLEHRVRGRRRRGPIARFQHR